MPTNSLRVVAVAVAAIVAVLTGAAAGFLAGGESCTITVRERTVPLPGTDRSTAPNQGGNPTDGPGRAGPVPSPQTKTESITDTACTGGTFGVGPAAAGFLGAALAGGVAAALLFVRRREDSLTAATTTTTAAGPPADGAGARGKELEKERATLVQTCIYVRDRATSKALADRLGWALHEVGVAAVTPAGQPFDPAKHEAGGAAPTTEAAKIGTIAAVEVPGYVDRGVVLRAPVVTVYREGQ